MKIGESEFDAEGQQDVIAQQFDHFLALLLGSTEERTPLPDLNKLLQSHTSPPYLTGRVLPPGEQKEARTVLLLLFGYRELRHEQAVSVLTLNQALRQSSCPMKRLDRVLKAYTKERLVLKSGQGKGGKYQLTSLGVQKAQAMVKELAALLP